MFVAGGHHTRTEADATQVNVSAVKTAVARAGDLGATSITRYGHLQNGTVARNKGLNLQKNAHISLDLTCAFSLSVKHGLQTTLLHPALSCAVDSYLPPAVSET